LSVPKILAHQNTATRLARGRPEHGVPNDIVPRRTAAMASAKEFSVAVYTGNTARQFSTIADAGAGLRRPILVTIEKNSAKDCSVRMQSPSTGARSGRRRSRACRPRQYRPHRPGCRCRMWLSTLVHLVPRCPQLAPFRIHGIMRAAARARLRSTAPSASGPNIANGLWRRVMIISPPSAALGRRREKAWFASRAGTLLICVSLRYFTL
jgi:hypothetical protein